MNTFIKEEEQREITLLNITHYNDFKEYEKYNNIDTEEFKEQLELGYIQEITLGLYNGATDTFTKRGITDNHIIEAIKTEIEESDFYNFFENDFIEKNYTNADWIRLYSEMYDVFTLNESIFVNMD